MGDDTSACFTSKRANSPDSMVVLAESENYADAEGMAMLKNGHCLTLLSAHLATRQSCPESGDYGGTSA